MADLVSAIAVVFLCEPEPLALDQLLRGWDEVWPQEPRLDVTQESGSLSWQRDGVFGAMSVMPVPVDYGNFVGEDGEQRRTSWLWPDAHQVVPTHRAHVLVVARGPDPLGATQALTRVTAAVITATGAPGVTVGADGPLVAGHLFVALSQAEPIPVLLWVDFPCGLEAGQPALVTEGLRHFGQLEVEIPTSAMACGELRMWTAQVAAYLIGQDVHLKDGETLGFSEQERVHVTHARSQVRPGEMINQLTGL